MASPICEERFDLPSPKRQKMMEAQTCEDHEPEDRYYDPKDPLDGTNEEWRRFHDEWSKSQGYEIDFSKLTFWGGWQPVDLEDSTWSDDDTTDGEFISMLAKLALTKHNAERGTSLELGKVLRANFHPSCGVTFYISFEVNDPSESLGNQTKLFRAMVRYMCEDDIEVCSCFPKPSS